MIGVSKTGSNVMSQDAFEAVRDATLKNNLVWLRSFGCEITHYENLIHVDHPQIRDYSAWLVFGPRDGAAERLGYVLDKTRQASGAPDIYVDESSYSSSVDLVLSNAEFKRNSLSLTIANFSSPDDSRRFTLQKAKATDFERWLSVYSEGFNRRGDDLEVDRYRWSRAFETGGEVEHWFFLSGEDMVGICQTCTAFRVIGVYSFTLRPEVRGLHQTRTAIRMLRAKANEQGETCIYLERLLPAHSRSRRRATPTSARIMTVRKMLGYRRLNDSP